MKERIEKDKRVWEKIKKVEGKLALPRADPLLFLELPDAKARHQRFTLFGEVCYSIWTHVGGVEKTTAPDH